MRFSNNLVLIVGSACCLAAAAAEPIRLRYNERPPFQVTAADGRVGGTVAAPAIQAFVDAGIAYEVILTPFKRQRAILEENREPACMMGWRVTPERARLGNFTLPVVEGSLQGAVTRADNTRMKDGGMVRDTLRDPALRLLAKEEYAVGALLAAAIARERPSTVRTTAESRNMLAMLLHGRADYLFMSEEEMAAVIAEPGSGLKPGQFRYVHFSDIHERVDRRLWCSRVVPAAVIERLNTAIRRRAAPPSGPK